METPRLKFDENIEVQTFGPGAQRNMNNDTMVS